MVATNNALDPQGKSGHVFWALGANSAVRGADGKYTYSVPAYGSQSNAVYIKPISRNWTPPKLEDYIFFAQFDNLVGVSLDAIDFEASVETVATGSNWRAARCSLSSSNTIQLALGLISNSASPSAKSFKLVNWGVYSISDWRAMQALGVTWFDGGSAFNKVTAKASVNIRGAF